MSRIVYIPVLSLMWMMTCCSPSKKFTQGYYSTNETTIQSILHQYKKIYASRPFSLEFKNEAQSRIAIEIHTDSIKYIYNFNLHEPFLQDTLHKYNFDTRSMNQLISDMQKVHCTWINNLDYYEKRQKKYLVFLSVRDKKLDAFLSSEKYFTLIFFEQKQPSDEKGRLLDNDDRKKMRKINGEIFRRINDKVFYAVTGHFR
ncbi:hypothetical protein [Terrimonas pollutisoli]|uniref:hypothetical protein n=1 Tax=Terrimonas pollutisoli TaxID=3034147 RepID=UPI0023ECD213|nr:hypothetical protein [Terrimonas sp. H1YJ31]